MSGSDPHTAPVPTELRQSGRSSTAAGWTNIALGLLIGVATLVGFVADSLGGAESPFFILVACLLVAVGAFSLAAKLSPVVIFGFSLLFFGLFLGFGVLVGGSVFGASDGAWTKLVGAGGLLLALLEGWTILAVWRSRKRRREGG